MRQELAARLTHHLGSCAAHAGASVPPPPGALCQRVEHPAHESHGGSGDRVRAEYAPMLLTVRAHEKGLITGISRLV